MNIKFNDEVFHQGNITPSGITNHLEELLQKRDPIPHNKVLTLLLEQFKPVDFREEAELNEDEKPKSNHYQIITIEKVLSLAKQFQCGICRNHEFIYLFNGAYWNLVEVDELKTFLGKAAERLSVDKWKARYFLFRRQLYEQFLTLANLSRPDQQEGTVLVNLINGTFEISPKKQYLREHRREDFITYQLPFEYNKNAECPLFNTYLNKVLPDIERQNILSEYLAYVFIQPSTLKLEKTLLLYGSGANGKSVFFEIVNALLGRENVSSFSLQQLTDIEKGGAYRAKIANKLVNYASEINGKLETSVFKAMVSGEPIEARALYGQPFQIENYAKLIFNCNELPKDVEHTNAFFRRFIIIPFDVTIPEAEQDKELSQKIIASELSGVFNWVLKGLDRLLKQKRFSKCEAVSQQVEQYKKQSDSVQMFLEEEGLKPSSFECIKQKELYSLYKVYCMDNGFKAGSNRTFGDRLKNAGFTTERKNYGMGVYAEK